MNDEIDEEYFAKDSFIKILDTEEEIKKYKNKARDTIEYNSYRYNKLCSQAKKEMIKYLRSLFFKEEK